MVLYSIHDNKASEAVIGTFHGGAGRLSTWENDSYTSTLNPDYVSATLESMKTVRTSVVPVKDFNKYALTKNNFLQAIVSSWMS